MPHISGLSIANVEDSVVQDVIPPEQGDDSKVLVLLASRDTRLYSLFKQPVSSPNSAPEVSLLASTNEEVDSVVQPGHRVFDCQLPAELPGSLKRLKSKRDSGQFSDVFLGVWEQPGVPPMEVAIKCIRRIDGIDEKRFNKRIRRETVIWKAANHPNILQFFGYQLCDAARGLRHLHSLTPLIVHGDIKPDNVIIKDNLEACLCDFGISRVFLGYNETTNLTTTNNMIGGTAGYQAKEVLEDGKPTTASDVYAFGGLVLAAMSGKGPFWKRENDVARIVAIISNNTPQPEDHCNLSKTDSLWPLLERCWRVDPEARPSIDIVLQELETEMEGR
ncbi:hypothetical protein FS837_010953 [Tulasnella sp. UAMH 9824]|nr:hypothetical protein FS837_010953 [Tulasnella sp. UAMH 9824]